MARRRFFVDQFQNHWALLAGEDAQHLSRVLRAQVGQRFELSDNRSVYLAEVTSIGPREVHFRLVEPIASLAPDVQVTLVASLIKFDRFEWIVEKATELGVEAIQPVASMRTETGLLEAAQKRVERWRRIGRESSQQSRRARIPEILPPQRLERLATGEFAQRLFLDEEPGGVPLAKCLESSRPGERIAILIGPEGGWTPEERKNLQAGWTPVSLGLQILRAETAAIAALAITMHHAYASARA